jgi:ABC-2 type transport system permease protein
MNTMKWLLKREYWENKGGFLWAPLVVSGIIGLLTIGSMLFGIAASGDKGGLHIGGSVNGMSLQQALSSITVEDKLEFSKGLAVSYPAVAVPLMITLGFVVFFYCLGCLFDERKDRSILFWKSLPVSDRDTVISKALTALVAGPLIAVAVSLALALALLFTLMLLAAFNGLNLFGMVLGDKNFYLVILQILSFIPIYVLWALPTVGYLMFVSSWAKTKPFLWAIGVPVLGGVIISWANMLAGSPLELAKYWEIVVGRGLGSVMPGTWLGHLGESTVEITPDNAIGMVLSNTYGLLGTANLWIGVAVGLAFLAGAVKMRRYRDEG